MERRVSECAISRPLKESSKKIDGVLTATTRHHGFQKAADDVSRYDAAQDYLPPRMCQQMQICDERTIARDLPKTNQIWLKISHALLCQ